MDGDYSVPGVLGIGDAAGVRRRGAAIAAAGARPLGDIAISCAEAEMARRATVAAVLLEAGGDSTALSALIDRLAAQAIPAVIVLPPALLDLAGAALTAEHLTLLCDPAPAEVAEALAAVLGRSPEAAVAERRDQPADLRRLAHEADRIARTLAALSEESRDYAGPPSDAPDEPSPGQVRAVIRARRLRDRFLDAELFADPAWDMLLDLMVARGEGRNMPVSSLCIAAAVPATTALRWIKILDAAGMVSRVADASDGRRSFVALTDAAAAALSRYFAELARLGLPGA